MHKRSVAHFKIWGLFLCLLALSIAPARLAGQVIKGSISGLVVDQSGAAVPGAQVKGTNSGTAQATTSITDTGGNFRIPLLPVGTYSLEITKTGFQKLVVSEVGVSAGVNHDLGTLQLKLGQVTTLVEVTAAPVQMQTSEAQVSTGIEGQSLTQFPTILANQGLDLLAVTLPGVNDVRDLGFSNTNGGNGFSVNGIRGRNNDQQIDGQNNNDNSVAGPYVFLGNVDFVQEYEITTSNFGAEYGRNSGSVVNIITKSGTNNWHGTVSGTEGNSSMNTLSNVQKAFEGLQKVPRFNDEFTGGTVGGPIWKDHAYLFGGFDDEIVSSRQVYSTGTKTPTPMGLAQLAACFPGSPTVAALQQFGPYGIGGGNPTPSGTISNPTLTNPNTLVTCPVQMGGVERTLPTFFHEYDGLVRIDVNGNTNRVYGRWLYQHETNANANSFATAPQGYPNNVPSFGQDFGLSWTHIFSPTMVNEARMSYGRLTVEFGGNSIGNTVPNQTAIDTALANISMPSGFLGFGPATNAPQGRIVNTWQGQDNWTYIRGAHSIKAGINWTWQRSPNAFLPALNGQFAFTSFSNFAADLPNQINVAVGTPTLDFREVDIFTYAGDDFKVRPDLTLNLGVTYSVFSQPSNLFHKITAPRESNPATAIWDPTLPLSIRTFPTLPTQYNNWGPSVGFAYKPGWGGGLTGQGKTVIRGGFRMAYDPAVYNIYLNMSSSTPRVLLQSLTGDTALANPMSAAPFGPSVRAQLAPFLTLGVFDPRSFNETQVSPDFRPDKIYSWSFGVQRELTRNTVLEARYVANHGTDLFESINGNPKINGLAAAFPNFVPSGVSPCPAASAVVPTAIGRVNCNEGRVRVRNNGGVSDYNGLQLEFRGTRIKNQLTIRTNYSWSKTTDNVSEIFSTLGGGNSLAIAQNPFDTVHGEHGLSGLDFPNKWSLSFVEELPFMRSQKGIIGHALGGWQISGTYLISSGQPYSPVQFCINLCSGGSVVDNSFNRAFFTVFEPLRPYLSSPSAPVTSVGVFAADACNFNGTGCALPPSQLLSWQDVLQKGMETTVTANSVRLIVNAPQANTVFGTPYGSLGRNKLRDYHSNIADAAIFKETTLSKNSERTRAQFFVSFANVFNHPNFSSIDPFLDDLGDNGEGDGFGIPSLQDGGHRSVRIGLKFIW